MEAKRAWRWERRGDDKEIFLDKVNLCLSLTVNQLAEQRGEGAKYTFQVQGTACAKAGLHLWNSKSSGVAGAKSVNRGVVSSLRRK